MSSIFKKTGLSSIFTASAFALFSAMSSPVMAQEQQPDPTDLVETFGDMVEEVGAVQLLVDSLNDGGFELAGMGTVMGQRGPTGHVAVFANDQNEWRMVSFDARFRTARVINEGHTFSTINYRYNIRINYDQDQGGFQLIPVQAQGENSNCMPENQFGRQVIKENYAQGFLFQGYDSDNDIMKIFINEEGGFLGVSIDQDRQRTTCGAFQGDGFRIAEDFIPALRTAP